MAGEDEDFGSARITIVLDDAEAVGEARDLGLRIRRALIRATNDVGQEIQRNIQRGLDSVRLSVQVDPDLDRITRQVRNLKLPQLPVDLIPDITGFMTRLRALLAGEEVSIRVVPDLDGFDARIRAHNAPDVTVDVNPDLNSSRLARALSGLGRLAATVGSGLVGLLQFGAVGIAAAGAATGVAALVGALAPAVGIIAALPAAVIGAQVALGTLKLALLGVEEAFTAALTGSAEEFEKSLEGLAPAAQKAARSVRKFRPELKALQKAVQQSFFKQFSGDIGGAIENLLPLRKGLEGIAAQFGKAASEGLKFLGSQQALAPLKQITQGVSDAASGLSVAIAPIAKGFLDIAAAVSQAFGKKVGDQIGQVGAQLGTYLSGLAASGKAVEKVSGAVKVFRQLKDILGNLKGAFGGIAKAADTVGAGLLDRLTKITQKIEDFTKSAAGQKSLGTIFQTTQDLASELGPILKALSIQLGNISSQLSPVFEALGPGIVNLLNGLGPALTALGPAAEAISKGLTEGLTLLAPALEPIGQALNKMGLALAPLLPLLGSLANALGVVFAPVLEDVAALLAPVVKALSESLGPVLPKIADSFARLAEAARPLAEQLGGALGDAIARLGPPLLELIPKFVDELIPGMERMSEVLGPLIPKFVDFLVRGIEPLLPKLPGLVVQLGMLITSIIELGLELGPAIDLIFRFGGALLEFGAAEIAVQSIRGLTLGLGLLIDAVQLTKEILSGIVDSFVAPFRTVYNILVGNSIIPDLCNGIVAYFSGLPGRAASALAGIVGSLTTPFRQAGSNALQAIYDFGSRAYTYLRGLPSRAASALSGARGALTRAGSDLVRGLIDGIESQIGSAVSAAGRLVDSVVSTANRVLDIGSPSKVFAKIGKFVGQGFIKGLTGTAAEIKKTAEDLASSITEAFKGKATRLDDRLVAFVKGQNKQLQALAKRRDGLIAQLTDARKFAADIAASAEDGFALKSLGEAGAITAQSITAGLRNAVEQIDNFRAKIAQLAQRGLRKDLLRQLIGLGPEQGAELAAVLARQSKASLKKINSLQRELTISSTDLGKVAADILFDSGKLAGEGFLEGLKGQRKAIEKLMLDIAKGMQRSIRAALDIRSPSHVFARIGELTGVGLQVGLLGQLGALQKAARTAARSVVTSVSSELGKMAGMGALGGPDFGSGGNVIPLTRAQRSRQRAESSGLAGALKNIGSKSGGGQPASAGRVVNNTINIHEVGNGRATAHRLVTRLAVAGGL
ncbi:hypothetical protein [Streptomyces sp. NPDC047070]|uniref:phage tail protein n=1 Tax=Streptomyces sp. NPDC047070 TaxID=3154923 RepID=UPI003455287D